MNIDRKDYFAFAKVYNDVEKYPNLNDVAEALGLAYQTIKNKSVIYRKHAALDDSLPNLVMRRSGSDMPMSEDSERFMEDWGPDECIDELRRVAELDPEMVVTRNYFRNHSAISEATWNRYFGTFEEFKRQAGIKLSRTQHKLERNIARHNSVDNYRYMNVERADFDGKYKRKNKNRFKTVLAASDLHDKDVDPFFLRVFLNVAKRVQPDAVALVGDIFDLPEFSRYDVDPREWDVTGRIKFVHDKILGPLREKAPDAEINFIEGNHEARLLKLLADATPALRAILSDLHGMTVSSLLGLDKYEINYIAKLDLGTFTERDHRKELSKNYLALWDSVLFHHFPSGRNMGVPGVNGHHHKHEVWPMFNLTYGSYEWHQMGAGHARSASYCEGEKWSNGFTLLHIDTEKKIVNFDYISITDMAVAGGKWYHREPKEILHSS